MGQKIKNFFKSNFDYFIKNFFRPWRLFTDFIFIENRKWLMMGSGHSPIKVLIIGNARHGKDTLAEILNREFGIEFLSSSQAANEIFIFETLKDKYGYKNSEECFNDRVNHREEWYNLICDYNKDDRSKLAKDIINRSDCYVGMRDYDEFVKSKDLFDIIIWVDASERLAKEIGSFNIDKKDVDIIIENNGSLEEFEQKSIRIGKLITQ